jgi:uncharacterized membrane protein (DUF2068 family)
VHVRWHEGRVGYDERTFMTHSRAWLLPWIVAFKVFKTVTLAALGVALLVTRHADPIDLLIRIALAFHLPLTSHWFDHAMKVAANLTIGRRTGLAITAFAYAALLGTEGVGLYLRRPWARWLTIIATSSLIPIEIYECLREIHLVRFAVLIINILVVIYLYRRKEIFE